MTDAIYVALVVTGSDGVGLGLAVAKGLTEAMGGTLTAEDTPGGGLTMTVELPAATPGYRIVGGPGVRREDR